VTGSSRGIARKSIGFCINPRSRPTHKKCFRDDILSLKHVLTQAYILHTYVFVKFANQPQPGQASNNEQAFAWVRLHIIGAHQPLRRLSSCIGVGRTLLTTSSRLSPSISSSPMAAKGRVTSVSSSSGRFRVINPFLSRIQNRLAASSKSRPCCRQKNIQLPLGGTPV